VAAVGGVRGCGPGASRTSRDFVFANPVELHTSMNPDFFKGTAVEAAVAKVAR